MPNNAVVWILTHEYFDEVKKSADSVKQYLPSADRILLSPDKYEGNHFTRIVKTNERLHKYWYLDEVHYFTHLFDLPYEKIIFLDSDMLLIQNCEDLWTLLDRFDLALAHAPTRQTAPPHEPIPLSFTEFCTGIIALRNNYRVRELFQEWYARYLQDKDTYINNDQVPLRDTLWITQIPLRLATLPPELNCRFGLPGSAIKPVRILHGRYGGSMEDVIKMVDVSHGMKAWQFGELRPK